MPARTASLSLDGFSDALADRLDGIAARLVAIRSGGRGTSTGIVWRPGLIVTAEEALDADDDIALLHSDGSSAAASLVGRDAGTDIALLRTEERPFPDLTFGSTSGLRAGHLVVAAGRRPEGIVAAFGIVALAGGPWKSLRGGHIDRRLHLDLRLDPRAEGGVVLDASGSAFGMTVLGPRGGVLVIPSETIERVARQLLEHGHVARGYLGLGLQPVRIDRTTAETCGLPEPLGLMVISADPDGPGQSAGVRQGDVLIRWNDQALVSVRGIHALLGPESVGQTVELELLRGGERQALPVRIGERPRP
jgi:S1-C subfamily serine protease